MAKVINQSLAFCPNCNKTTIHYSEGHKSISWLVHFILVVITAGLWLFMLALVMLSHVMSIPIGRTKSTCSNCGLKH